MASSHVQFYTILGCSRYTALGLDTREILYTVPLHAAAALSPPTFPSLLSRVCSQLLLLFYCRRSTRVDRRRKSRSRSPTAVGAAGTTVQAPATAKTSRSSFPRKNLLGNYAIIDHSR